MSGVHAAKGGAMLERYNSLSGEISGMLNRWRAHTYRNDPSLFAALRSAPDAPAQLAALLEREGAAAAPLLARLAQFRSETEEIIPAVTAALAAGDLAAIGPLVARSQDLAERVLRNQVDETIHLVRQALALGAAAASAFGAGFGGSVWALVRTREAKEFRRRWQQEYLAAFPGHRARADFFLTDAGPPAGML